MSEGKRAIAITSADELLMTLSSLLMHWMDQRHENQPDCFCY